MGHTIDIYNISIISTTSRLALNVVDTPGFGDGVDNTGCWEPIIQYVDQQFNMFLEAETQVSTNISTISTYLYIATISTPGGEGPST